MNIFFVNVFLFQFKWIKCRKHVNQNKRTNAFNINWIKTQRFLKPWSDSVVLHEVHTLFVNEQLFIC